MFFKKANYSLPTQHKVTIRTLLSSVSLTTLLGTVALVAPQGAYASNECGAAIAGVATCNSAQNFANGISYSSGSSLELNIDNPAITISGSGAKNAVLLSTSGGSANNLIMNVKSFDKITYSPTTLVGFLAVNGSTGATTINVSDGEIAGTSANDGNFAFNIVSNNTNNTAPSTINIMGGKFVGTASVTSRGKGDAIIDMSGGSINGVSAFAVGDAGNASITLSGGDLSRTSGVVVNAVTLNGNKDNAKAEVTVGAGTTITSTDNSNSAIVALAGNNFTRALIHIQGGVISGGKGVSAQASTGLASIDMTGGTVSGQFAGLYSNSISDRAIGVVSIKGGDVSNSGDNADAVWAQNSNTASVAGPSSGSVVMTGGSVATTGTNSNGLRASNAGLGAASVRISNGTVTTTGDKSYGIFSETNNTSGSGTNSIVMNGGTVTTNGKDAYGIYSISSSNGIAGFILSKSPI